MDAVYHILLSVVCMTYRVLCFNVDTENPLIFQGNANSHFGTTSEMLESAGEKWLLVGAPYDNFTDMPDIYRPGNVLRCPIQVGGSNPRSNCQALRIRSAENTLQGTFPGIYEQTEQNLGSSIVIGSSSVVVCAPLWKNLNNYQLNRYYNPTGHCYELDKNNLTDIQPKVFRIKSDEWQIGTFQYFGAALFGFSSTATSVCAPLWKDLRQYQITNRRFYLTYGICHEINKDNLDDITPKYFNIEDADLFRSGGQFMSTGAFGFSLAATSHSTYSVILGSPNTVNARGGFSLYVEEATANFVEKYTVLSGPAINDSMTSGAYLGYAVASGVFGTDATAKPQIVIGAPGFTDTNGPVGAVSLLELDSTNQVLLRKQFTGTEIGSGYGQSVLVMDINKDNRDDLLVGAPLQSGNVGYEEGAVHIYYGTGDGNYLRQPDNDRWLTGIGEVGGRFGLSLAALGDIDADSYNDLAVGAPYEDGMKGAVYIFNGKAGMLTNRYSQRIQASSIDNRLRAFGFYISKQPLDVDDNLYNDFAVGAYQSDQTVILRSRPIIVLMTDFRVPTIVPLNSTNMECSSSDNSFPCATLELCFSFTGRGVEEGIYIDFTMRADTLKTNKKQVSRVDLYYDGENRKDMFSKRAFRISKSAETCAKVYARVNTLDRSFFQSIAEELHFEAVFDLSNSTDTVTPVLDNEIEKRMLKVAQFDTGCASSCSSNLQVQINVTNPDVVLGETREIVVTVNVRNTGEPAYAASVIIQPSDNTAYRGFDQANTADIIRVSCSRITNTSNVQCDFLTPMLTNRGEMFQVRFDVSRERLTSSGSNLTSIDRVIQINATVRNNAEGSTDQDLMNNFDSKKAYVRLRSDIILSGLSTPEQAKFTSSRNGYIVFSQTYTIDNDGPSPSPGAMVYIDIPVRASETTPMKYLTMQNKIQFRTSSDESAMDTCQLISFPGQQVQRRTTTTTTMSMPPMTTGESTGRRKRDVAENEEPEAEKQTAGEKYQDVACSKYGEKDPKYQLDYDCARVLCMVYNLDSNKFRTIGLSLNISEAALPAIMSGSSFVRYFTEGTVYAIDTMDLPYEQTRNTTAIASIDVFPVVVDSVTQGINLWIIIGASVGGLLLLIIIFVVLWKTGFFKREKREQVNEYKRKTLYQLRQSRMSMRSGKAPPPDTECIMPKGDSNGIE